MRNENLSKPQVDDNWETKEFLKACLVPLTYAVAIITVALIF